MANPLYNEQMQNGIQSQLNSLMSNPSGFLSRFNIDVPLQYQNNPQGLVQYWLNSGRITQGQLNSLIQKAQQFGFKI